MRLRWLVPIAVLYSLRLLAADDAVKPRVATITINPSEVTTLHLRPEFESVIHMPEEITSVSDNFLRQHRQPWKLSLHVRVMGSNNVCA